MKNNITFILFTYNEEKRIEYAVRNFVNYGQVILLDGGSTDRTQEIAESLGATFLVRPPVNLPFVENQPNLDFIKQNISTEYIYWGYVDNIAPKSLVEKLIKIANEKFYKRVTIPMITYLWGQTKYPVQHSHIAAFFHKDAIDFRDNTIHHFGRFLGTTQEDLTLPNQPEFRIHHFSTYNEEKFVRGYMRYGETEAKQKFENGERFSVIKLFAAMLRYCWIYRNSIKNPKLGTLIMLNMAFGRLMTYTLLYEYENDISLDNIENSYAEAKEKILNA